MVTKKWLHERMPSCSEMGRRHRQIRALWMGENIMVDDTNYGNLWLCLIYLLHSIMSKVVQKIDKATKTSTICR